MGRGSEKDRRDHPRQKRVGRSRFETRIVSFLPAPPAEQSAEVPSPRIGVVSRGISGAGARHVRTVATGPSCHRAHRILAARTRRHVCAPDASSQGRHLVKRGVRPTYQYKILIKVVAVVGRRITRTTRSYRNHKQVASRRPAVIRRFVLTRPRHQQPVDKVVPCAPMCGQNGICPPRRRPRKSVIASQRIAPPLIHRLFQRRREDGMTSR